MTGRLPGPAGMARDTSLGLRGFGSLAVVGVAFLALPVIVLLARGVLGSDLVAGLRTPAVADALVLSLATTATSLVVTVAVGLPVAWALARRRFPGRRLVETVVDLPIVLPPSVAGLALLLAFGRRGVLGGPLEAIGIAIPFTTAAVVVAQAFVAAPFFIRSVRAGLLAVDRDLEDAARVDGAAELQVLRWITLPISRAAIGAGLVLAWARALGEFGATIMFAGNIGGQTQTLPLLVYGEFQGGDLQASIAAATILVLAAVSVLVAARTLRRDDTI